MLAHPRKPPLCTLTLSAQLSTTMSGTGGDDGGTVPVTTAEVPTTTASQPVPTTGTRTPTPRPRSQVALGVLTFFTPSGLSQQGARLLQPRVVLNPFTLYNPGHGMSAGSLTQWGHFNPGSTTEMYLLMEGPCRESPWDPPGDSRYQASSFSADPGGSVEDSLSRWYEELPDGCTRAVAEIEVPVERPVGGGDDEDDLWMCRMAAVRTAS
ncbi:UNVERIFIED_CONTAM: hypothetical protein K2H54_066235 [Gekko kuhli]